MNIKKLLVISLLLTGSQAFASAIINTSTSHGNSSSIVQSSYWKKKNLNYHIDEARINQMVKPLQMQLLQNPEDLNTHYEIFNIFISENDIKQAAEQLIYTAKVFADKEPTDNYTQMFLDIKDKYSAMMHNTPDFALLSGAIELNLKNYEDANKYFNVVLKNQPNSVDYKLDVAVALEVEKDYVKALNLCNLASRTNPYNYLARLQKAKLLQKMGKEEESIQEYKTISQMFPSVSVVKAELYNYYKDKVKNDKALIQNIMPEYEMKPIDEQAYTSLASALLETYPDDAMKYYKVIIDKYPKNAEAYVILSSLYKQKGDYDSAKALLEIAQREVDDQIVNSAYNSIIAQLGKNPYSEAKELIKNGLYRDAINVYSEFNQTDIDVLLGMATCYHYLGENLKSNEYLDQALSLYPDNADVYYTIAFINMNNGNNDIAKTNISKALAINPNHKDSLNLHKILNQNSSDKLFDEALLAYEAENYQETLRLLDKAIEINENNSTAYYYRGLTYMSQSNFAKATGEFYRTIKLDPNNALAYYSLAVCFDNLSEAKHALPYYKKFIELTNSTTYNDSEYMKFAKSRIEKIEGIQK